MAKRALLIGINRYQVAGADLRGCVNDVDDMRSVLVTFYGFRSSDISVLTDRAATKQSIQDGIEMLVNLSEPGDVAVLHFSGHGSSVPDNASDEADGRDEILCPADLDWDDPLRDDWLRGALDRLHPGVSFTAIMDCCHSGTNTRAILGPDAPVKQRYLPSPWNLKTVQKAPAVPGQARTRDLVTAGMAEVLITGCRDTQTSADAFINGRYNGALTFAIIDAIRTTGGHLTYRALHDRASAALKQRQFDQEPQLEGQPDRFDRVVFSV